MERVPGWEKRLLETVKAEAERSFTWGTSDCVTFAARCVEAVTGRDVLGPLRGSYGTRLAARARMKARGWVTLADAAAELLGPEIDPRASRAGDVGVTLDGVLCVRLFDGFTARDSKGRVLVVPGVSKAWKVG